MRVGYALLVVALSALATAACSALLGLEPPPPDEDAGVGRLDQYVPPADGGGGGGGACVPLDAATDADASWSPLTEFPLDGGDFAIELFDMSPLGLEASNYQGGVFDGRWVYYSPGGNGFALRYDSTNPFLSTASWEKFDITANLGPTVREFSGTVFDGRYVYYIQHSNPAGGLVVRYDSSGAFADPGSWSLFDVATLTPTLDGGARGYAGGVTDGRYVYLVPEYNGVARSGLVARYDTIVPSGGTPIDSGVEGGPPVFGTLEQWSTFDTSTRDPSALGFWGGVFDGRYVYLVPYVNGGSTNAGQSGVTMRYDTEDDAGFGYGGSWTYFDTEAFVSTSAVGFVGGAFDGRYLYLTPHFHSTVARYDTQASFNTGSSWSSFDLSQVILADGGTTSFFGAGFDGRFVYFVPDQIGVSYLLRYDTLSPFTSTCAWSTFDLSLLRNSAVTYTGAVYDGRWLYLMPRNTLAVRFDTKTPAWLPALPAHHGSFY
jgi:hypothetical protein